MMMTQDKRSKPTHTMNHCIDASTLTLPQSSFAWMTGHIVVRYHRILLMSIFQLGVTIMFSLQGLDAHLHISFFCRMAFLTGTRMMRIPFFFTLMADLIALHLLVALPSVTRLLPYGVLDWDEDDANPVLLHLDG